MRALSWREPFATLMLHGKIETRTWATNYRGLVLICASKKPYSPNEVLEISGKVQYSHVRGTLMKEGEEQMMKTLGHAIAVGELVDCKPMGPDDNDKCFVRYDDLLYCHVYENVRAIEPIAFKGQLGWKKLEKEFINSIKYKS